MRRDLDVPRRDNARRALRAPWLAESGRDGGGGLGQWDWGSENAALITSIFYGLQI